MSSGLVARDRVEVRIDGAVLGSIWRTPDGEWLGETDLGDGLSGTSQSYAIEWLGGRISARLVELEGFRASRR